MIISPCLIPGEFLELLVLGEAERLFQGDQIRHATLDLALLDTHLVSRYDEVKEEFIRPFLGPLLAFMGVRLQKAGDGWLCGSTVCGSMSWNKQSIITK